VSIGAEVRSVAVLSYRVILEPEPDGTAYNVIVPAFPHAHTFGSSVAEAMANGREVIELEEARSRRDAIPPSDARSGTS
jgi:predicted RNase H-like HicB family nuclease